MANAEWSTSISTIRDDKTIIRDKLITDLVKQNTFAGNIYFILTGKKATSEIDKLLNTLFSLSLDHGLGVISTLTARLSTSAGVPVQQSLIAALSSMGHFHGGATEDAAHWISENVEKNISPEQSVKNLQKEKKKVPGYGHKILKRDERAEMLLDHAKELNLFGKHCDFAQSAEQVIKELFPNKQIPLNIDGAIAAIALDLGFSWKTVTGLFIIGRLPGLIAHIKEEREQDNGLRRLSEDKIDYISNN